MQDESVSVCLQCGLRLQKGEDVHGHDCISCCYCGERPSEELCAKVVAGELIHNWHSCQALKDWVAESRQQYDPEGLIDRDDWQHDKWLALISDHFRALPKPPPPRYERRNLVRQAVFDAARDWASKGAR